MTRVTDYLIFAISLPSVLGTYLITSPKSIIRGTDYDITVEILNTTNVDIIAQIEDQVYDGKIRKYTTNVLKTARGTFNQGLTGHLSMPIEDTMSCRACQLRIRGRGGLQFERKTSLFIQRRLVSVLIQTDKAIYKPGQKVRYRALAVYPDLQVYTGMLNVEIKDPRNNKIKVHRGLSSPTGTIEGQLDLSEQPPFGEWSITVFLEETSDRESQPFTVASYELPRFEITVELPPYKLIEDDTLTGSISAKYTFGQPVKGMVELHVGPDQGPDPCGKLPQSVESAFEIDGEAKFTVPKSDIQRVIYLSDHTNVRVWAFVKEASTGVRLNGSSVVTFYQNEYKVKFLENTPSVFKPGLPYIAFVQASTPDDMPPSPETNDFVSVYAYASYEVKVSDGNLYGVLAFTGNYPLPGYNVSLPTSGVLPIELNIPENATSITLNVHYKGQKATKTVSKAFSESKNYMQLSLESKNLKAGEDATFKLQATEPLHSVFYVIMSRGSVVLTGNVEGRGMNDVIFSVAITSSLAPTAHLLAYYTRESSDIVADSIAFNVDGIFNNKVSLVYNKNETEPNKEVDLIVTADPNSMVSLLAVDQSVLLLKSGNDITTDKVKDAISSYDLNQKPSKSEYALSYSAKSVADVFSQTGLIVITDLKMTAPPPTRQRFNGHLSHQGGYALYSANSFEEHRAPNTGVPAFEHDMSPESLQKVDHLRKIFPEAWLWTSVNVSSSGRATINTTVPDTITSWVTSAFATNALSGLGVAPTTANLTVFRPFFVSLKYPSSVKRNEQAVIQATVFNYLFTDVTVLVTLKPSSNYQSINIATDGTQSFSSSNQEQRIRVKSGEQGVVFFPVVAKEIGVADIEVTAQTTIAADGVRRQIFIEAEGAPVSFNYPSFITLGDRRRRSRSYEDRISLALPTSFVTGSEKTRVKVSGDLIGPSLDNIDSLLTLPTGCGEQSMVKFAPDLYIAKYLKSTGQWTNYWNQRITSLLDAGYQRQLSYQRNDGGFSAFGDSDEAGSTWLTAFVSRTFSEARDFIYVDPSLLTRSVDWLLDRQNKDGSFSEFGKVLDQNTQGSKSGPALTAYVLLALLQNKDLAPIEECQLSNKDCFRARKLMNATTKAIANLEDTLASTSDLFSLAVVSYALGEAKSGMSDNAFNKLLSRANRDGHLIYWSVKGKLDSKTPDFKPFGSRNTSRKQQPHQARPIDILITSYALLSYNSHNRLIEGVPALIWLTKQRNTRGGFASTQDTTVALQALATYAANTITSSTNMNIQAVGDSEETLNFDITTRNALVLQTKEFKTPPRTVDIQVTGTGFTLTEIDHSFNVKEELITPSFDVNTVLLDDDLDSFNLMICTKWLWDRKTGMVVQEIGIPSGFKPDMSTLGSVVGMKRSERRGRTVAIYFDEIGKTSVCYSILMTRQDKVAKSEQSYIRTFDYYEPSDMSTVFYQPKKLRDSTICDICEKCCA